MMKRHGFIIPLVLILISMIMMITTSVYQRGSLFVPFLSTLYKREQAKALALSGIQIAMSQIGSSGKKEEEKKETPQQPAFMAMMGQNTKDIEQLFVTMFPRIDQWQTFNLKKDIDGVDGSIKIAVACEDGKINLNAIYDFAKKKFVGEGALSGDWKKIMQDLCLRLQKQLGVTTNLFEPFEKFLKQRQYKVNDASELLLIDQFRPFAQRLFYEPPAAASAGKKERPVYLLDIFTVYGYGRFQPWMLSDGMRTLLGMKRGSGVAQGESTQTRAELLKKFKPSINLAQDWKTIFAPIYGIEFAQLPKGIDAVFETTFDPRLFSVVSYGVVGDVTVRVYAILERVRRFAKQKSWYDIKIKKFYWI